MRVLLVDDHPLILSALRSVIEGIGKHVEVYTADTAREARQKLHQHEDFDLMLLDLQLGDVDGWTVLSEFRSAYPALPVVVVSAMDSTQNVIRAIDLGAMGFVPKRSSNENLCSALQLVMSGGIYIPPINLEAMDEALVRHEWEQKSTWAPASVSRLVDDLPYGPPLPEYLQSLGLTRRQADVLSLMLKGLSNKTIAKMLGVSADTVKDHITTLFRVLNVSSRTQAILAVGELWQRENHHQTIQVSS
jgi:DNA-binding NarL/FixJ family response regulator